VLDCKIAESVRFGERSRLRFMCPRCRFKYSFENVGPDLDVWDTIVRRIQASGGTFTL
jgi:hypothetical protein